MTDLGTPSVLSPDEADRAVRLAAPRGYCAGVDRAVITVEKALDLYGSPVYVRKQIVHNKHVVANLESRGAIFVEELDEVPEGKTVVFSAHGVSPLVHEQAAARNLKTIDATCPLVTKVHHEAKRFASDDYDILLIGHEGHEEVEGTAGEAPEHIQLVQSPDDVRRDRRTRPARRSPGSPRPRCRSTRRWPPSTRSAQRFPQLLDPPSDDICYATQNRQLAIKEISDGADLVIVVGSANSSNSVRLAEVALEAGAKAAHRVDDATEIDEAWLEGVQSVSVTSGASVPDDLVDGVLAFLTERGYPDAQAVHTAEESLIFALPPELRRDMRKAAAAQGELSRRGPLLRRPPGRPAAAGDRPGRRPAARGRADRLPDRLRLRARHPARQPRRARADQEAAAARRQAPLHAGLPRLRPARPAGAPEQRGVPGDQGGDAGALHVHPAGDRRGAEAADAPEEAHRRRTHPRPRRWCRRCWRSSASRCCPARC